MKMFEENRLTLYLLTVSLFIAFQTLIPESPGFAATSGEKVYYAARTDKAPRINGRLNDIAWLQAPDAGDFSQEEPDRFAPPTESTLFKILYDDEALFVAVRCFDREPDLIKGALSRRDEDPPSDYVSLYLDSRNDNQTCFEFTLNAAGTMRDVYIYDDGNDSDDSWDAVWEGHCALDDSGWTAEIRIPFTALRFPPVEEQVWGMSLSRNIHRKNEVDSWVVVPRDERGYVSRFGELRGIKDIPQPFNLEILPYASSKYQNTEDKTGFSGGAGVDFKYSISSGVILDATVNPDFGQVEADPSVLNLGVFETYFPEKRPFFLEGAAIFETEYDMFYSRRIGKRPCYYDLEDDEDLISKPENTTILGAVKVTGKTQDGVSFGLMEAVTEREYGKVENEEGDRYDKLIEPNTNHFVGRIIKDIWEGNSSIGGIATAMNREAGMSAYSAGFDWNLYFRNNDYHLAGMAAFSDRGDTHDDRESGYALDVEFSRSGYKHHGFYLGFETKSPDFNIRDMGYLGRRDVIKAYAEYLFRTRDPVGIFRRTVSGIETWQYWNYDGNHTENGIGLWTNLRFMNYWDTNFGVNYEFPRYSDLETRGGPLLRPPGNYGGWFWGGTDWRKKFRFTLNFWGGENASRSWWGGVYPTITYRPIDRMETSVSFCYERMFDENQWVDNIDDDNDSTHYVFGRLDKHELYMIARLSYNFTRDISLQLYAQPFNAVGKYREYIELAEPGTYKFKPYNPEDDYDFNAKEFNMNLVFRWEYAPGSTIYAVWSRGMCDEENAGRYNPRRNFGDLAMAEPDDIFLIKFNRWFNY